MILRDIKKGLFRSLLVYVLILFWFVKILPVIDLVSSSSALHKNSFSSKITCGGTDEVYESELRTYIKPSESVSARYRASTQDSNLWINPDMQTGDSGLPLGYVTDGTEGSVYELSEDQAGRFLKTTKLSYDNVSIGWAPTYTAITTGPYYYAFYVRGSVPVNLGVDMESGIGSESKGLFEIAPTNDWLFVEGHIRNHSTDVQRLRVTLSTTEKGEFEFKNPVLYKLGYKDLGQPLVSIVFDDGWQSFYDKARPILDAYGFKTTQFIIAALAHNDTYGYMGANEIVKLERGGHEIASHSLQHCDLSSLSDDEISYDLEEQKKLFSQMGIKASGFSYPFGHYNSKTQDILAREFSYIRTSEDGFNDFYVDLNNIHVKTVTSTTNQTDIQQWLDYAKSNKLWLVLLYHRIDETGDYSTKVEDFSKQIKVVKDSGIRVLSVRSALKELGKL